MKVGELKEIFKKGYKSFFLSYDFPHKKKKFGHFSQKRQTDRRQTDLFNCRESNKTGKLRIR